METRKLSYTMPAKVIGFFLFVLSFIAAAVGAVYIAIFARNGFYEATIDDVCQSTMYEQARLDAESVLYQYHEFANEQKNTDEKEKFELDRSYWEDSGSRPQMQLFDDEEETGEVFYYLLKSSSGATLAGDYGGQESLVYQFDGAIMGSGIQGNEYEGYYITIYVNKHFPAPSVYFDIYCQCWDLWSIRYYPVGVEIGALFLGLISYIFLLCSAGHRNGRTELSAGPLVRLPLEIYSVIVCLLVLLGNALADASDIGYYTRQLVYGRNWGQEGFWYEGGIAVGFAGGVTAVMIAGVSMNLAVRLKQRAFLKNTIIYRLMNGGLHILRIWFGTLKHMLLGLPSVARTAAALTGIIFIELFIFIIYIDWPSKLMLLFLLEKAIVFFVVIYFAISLRTLERGGEALAGGDLNYQIDTRRMRGELKQLGKNLNSISEGMNVALNERMKSERMKTELITNVSHDIKTPLTSIINYTDLITKEHSDNEKINEYAAVLSRQSARLKKLIEDLVEASKASTGNVEVHLMPMEAGVIIVQAAGEYEERLQEKNLQLIVKQPKEPLRIMADGRHLWRVIDNLMNNICKYAQPQTRVYLSLEAHGNKAYICFKNTSNYPLDIPVEELMERFVRGDSSRSTEGNGLGLSIAQSLTTLQKGNLELAVDGDLFKATLIFDLLPPEEKKEPEQLSAAPEASEGGGRALSEEKIPEPELKIPSSDELFTDMPSKEEEKKEKKLSIFRKKT